MQVSSSNTLDSLRHSTPWSRDLFLQRFRNVRQQGGRHLGRGEGGGVIAGGGGVGEAGPVPTPALHLQPPQRTSALASDVTDVVIGVGC
eukprot:1732406-Rhodomonas_salina.1